MAMLSSLFPDTFQPTDITGLSVWLDAADLGSLTIGGGTVSLWRDKSGRGNNAVQASGALQPDYVTSGINGRPAVSFGVGDRIVITDNATLDYSALDIFCVLQRNVDSGATQVPFTKYGGATLSAEFQLMVTAADVWQLQASTTGASTNVTVTTAITATVGQPFLVETGYNGTSGFLTVNNGTPQLAAPSAGFANSDGNLTFGRATGADFQGAIGEFLMFTRKLNASETEAVALYLRQKWGV